MIVVGGIVALVGASAASQVSSYGFGGKGSELAGLVGLIPGLDVCLTGFILLALVQMGRASVDSAEYSQQMLKIARDQLQISKQGLKQSQDKQLGFSDLQSQTGTPSSTFASTAASGSIDVPATNGAPNGGVGADVIQYSGFEILKRDSMYYVGEKKLFSLLQAEDYIDSLNLGDATHSMKAAGSSDSNPVDRIVEEDGKFTFARMEFSSRESAERYVSQLGVNSKIGFQK